MKSLLLFILISGCSARQITDEDLQHSAWARDSHVIHETIILEGFKREARMAGLNIPAYKFVEFTGAGYCRLCK